MNDDILQLALNGQLTEEQAIGYLESVCGDRGLVREIVQKVATASVIGTDSRVRVAWDLVEWLKDKCTGNRALMTGVLALMLTSGALSAHEVKKGDTLWSLGGGTSKGVEKVLVLNPGMTRDTVLKPGMKIVLPNEAKGNGTYTVAKGDTFYGIARKLGMTVDALKALNPQVSDISKLSVGQKINTSGTVQKAEKKQVQKAVQKPAQQAPVDAKTDYVARVIYAESGNSVDEMEMIAHVIVNRMKDSSFPSSAYGVVTQDMQFSCTSGTDGNVKWRNYKSNGSDAMKECYRLAKQVVKKDASGLKGRDDVTFYCTKSMARQCDGKVENGTALQKEYGHPKGWGTRSVFTPVETSANHVFYTAVPK